MLKPDEVRLLELRAKGKTLRECANILGRSYDSTRWMWRKIKHRPGETLQAAADGELEVLPVRPVEIEPRVPMGAITEQGAVTAIHYGDTHFPFQDDGALEILYQLIHDLSPDLVVHHGDLLDCYSISNFEKNPEHRVGFQRELEMAAEHLGQIAVLAPEARRVLIRGNHEDRRRRLLWKAAEKGPIRELLYLPEVKEVLTWPRLLGLESSGWEWVESKEILFDRLILKHGDVVRKHSAYSARAEMERYSKSGISGHTHRAGVCYERDWNGYHGWWELGCLCDLDPEYAEHPNWQQGFVVVTWSEDRESFGVEPVTISEGRAVFRGVVYDGLG